MLTLGVLGIRLALGAQTEREGVKLRPAHLQPHPGTRCRCFPGFPYFIHVFSRLLHHHIPTQALPKLSAGCPDPHPGLFCSRISCNPIHPHLEILDKTSPGSTATPLRTQTAAPRLLWMVFPQSFPLRRTGRSPRASLVVLGGGSTCCHLPRVGAREEILGSGAGGSAGRGSLGVWGPFLLTGIGCGSICLGKPLKNQAPERFHTCRSRDRPVRAPPPPLSPPPAGGECETLPP